MRLWRIIPFIVLVGVMGTAFWGAATQLDVNAQTLIAGSGKVERCDDSGVQIWWRSEWNKASDQFLLKGVTVAGIDSDCDGKSVRVVVTDKAGEKLALVKTSVPTTVDNNVRIEFDKCRAPAYDPFDPQSGCRPPLEAVNGVSVAIHD